MNKKQYSVLLIALIVIFVVVGGGFPTFLSGMLDGRLIPVFIVYFIAGYIRRFVNISIKNSKKHLLVALIFYILLFFSFYIITFIGKSTGNNWIANQSYYYRMLNSPLTTVICLELFIAFLKIDIPYNRFINMIAGSTFGVYLIHSNRIISGVILPTLFPIYKEHNSILIFVYSVFGVITIYVSCTLIDLLRRLTIDKLWTYYLNNKFDKHYKIFIKILKSIYKKFIAILNKYYT